MNTSILTSENITVGGRFLRFALGAALMIPVFTLSGHLGGWAVLTLLAVFPIISAIYGYCPLVNWVRNLAQNRDVQLGTDQRIEYGLLAAVLIASVFVASGPVGFWLLLPLLGIYPAALAMFGEKLVSAVIASGLDHVEQAPVQKTSATIMSLMKSPASSQHHVSVDHAA